MNKKDNFVTGRHGEDVACDYLVKKGYSILARNLRTPSGEIDIVARCGDCLVVVEVKAKKHSYFGLPEEMVDDGKIQRVLAASDLILTRFSPGEEVVVRFDVVAIDLDNAGGVVEIRHHEAYDQ